MSKLEGLRFMHLEGCSTCEWFKSYISLIQIFRQRQNKSVVTGVYCGAARPCMDGSQTTLQAMVIVIVIAPKYLTILSYFLLILRDDDVEISSCSVKRYVWIVRMDNIFWILTCNIYFDYFNLFSLI